MTKPATEERVAHTPRTNDTKIPWQSGIFQDNDGVRHLAIWPESIPLGTIANPVCLISAEATADNVDEANAAFIVTACNAHEALVDALRAATLFINHRNCMGESERFPDVCACGALQVNAKCRAALSLATEGRRNEESYESDLACGDAGYSK